MVKKGLDEKITIMEAVDNLSSIAELDVKEVEAEQGEEQTRVLKWLNPKDKEKTYASVRKSFKAVHDYLKRVYHKDKSHLKDMEMRRGIQAIMVLVGEAAENLDRCSSLFFKVHGMRGEASHLKEYQDLQKFYHEKIIKKFQQALENEEEWVKEWLEGKENVLDVERVGLKDLETVKRDREYELLLIKDDEGRPFVNRNLLRHIKLVSDFDDILEEDLGEDPFLKIKTIQDKDYHQTAKELMSHCETAIRAFQRDALKFKEHQIVNLVNMSVMALMLAANDRNTMSNTFGKSSFRFFHDFLFYLREAYVATDYPNLIEQDINNLDPLMRNTLKLMHELSYYLFCRKGDREDFRGFVYEVVRKARKDEMIGAEKTMLGFCNQLMEYHDDIERILRRYPNGPLFKTLDVFRDRDLYRSFDPIQQENTPSFAYKIKSALLNSEVIRLPCPTCQESINHAMVIPEFKGFLRMLMKKDPKAKLVIFNFQDRTSWQEFSRCEAIEKLQRDAEFAKNVWVVTLPKSTDFYLQSDVYIRDTDAKDFFSQISDQIDSADECGFCFPKGITKKDLKGFTSRAIPVIHKVFFDEKPTLSRKNRLDFIEIFYLLIQLKVLEILSPEYISFTCKDAIDVGASSSAAFYGLMRVLSKKEITEEDQDIMMWMIHTSALFIRERPIDVQRLNRMCSVLSLVSLAFSEKKPKDLKALGNLFDENLLKGIILDSN